MYMRIYICTYVHICIYAIGAIRIVPNGSSSLPSPAQLPSAQSSQPSQLIQHSQPNQLSQPIHFSKPSKLS